MAGRGGGDGRGGGGRGGRRKKRTLGEEERQGRPDEAALFSAWTFGLRFVKLAFDDVLRRTAARTTVGACLLCRRSLGVHLLAQGVTRLLHLFGELPHPSDIASAHRFTQLADLVFDPIAVGGRNLVPQIAQRLLGLIGQGIGLVARLDQLAALFVLRAVPLGLVHHPFGLLLAPVGRGGGGGLR